NGYNSNRPEDQCRTVPEDSEGDGHRSQSVSHIMAVFCKPMFFIVVLLGVVIHYTHQVFLSIIVDSAIDRGMSLDTASSLLVYTSLTDFIGALGLPLFADKKVLRRSTLVMCCHVSLGVCLTLFPVVTSIPVFVLVSLLVAMLASALITMKSVMMADYLGVEMIPMCFAATGIASIPLFLWNPAIVGLFRDEMGSYDNLYRLAGGMNFFMALLFFGVFLWEHRSREGWTSLN
ncbi:unnamed protein product, partial [Ixodes hexagonus]